MSETPRFSVAVPAYNAAHTLPETVESVRAQSFKDWELVIVDDGSTDSTREVAEAFAAEDARIRVVSQANTGTGGAYNTAVREARSDLLVMLSADDLLLPEHMTTLDVAVRETPGVSIFSSAGYYQFPDGTRKLTGVPDAWADPTTCAMSDLLRGSFFAVGAVFTRALFEGVGGFREGIYVEDYLFWLLAEAHGFRHRHVGIPLAVHRRSVEQKSSDLVRVRLAEMNAILEVMETGLLSPGEYEQARNALSRLRANVAVRRILGVMLGQHGASRLLDRIRGRHA